MTPSVIASLAIAAVAVLGSIGSVLALSYHTGKLVGTVSGFMTESTQDRRELWEAIGKATEKYERHIEAHAAHR